MRLKTLVGCSLLLLGVLVLFCGMSVWRYARVRLAIHHAVQSMDTANPEDVLAGLLAAEQLRPDDAEVQYFLAVTKRRLGKVTDAEPHLRRASQLGWPGEQIKLQRALAAVQACDFATAEPYLRKVAASGPTNDVALQIYEALTRGYMSAYRLRDALLCLGHWIEWRPADAQPRYLRAAVSLAILDRPKAEIDLAEALKLEPENPRAHFGYAECLVSFNKIAEALVHYQWCHEREPDNIEFALGLADCLFRMGRIDEAKRVLAGDLPKGIRPDQEAYALFILGRIDMEEKRYQQAVERLSRAVELVPTSGQAHYSLAHALTRVGRGDEAKVHLARSAKSNDDTLRLEELSRDVVNHPADSALRVEAGALLLRRGNLDEAQPILLSAIQIDPQAAEAHALLAEIYEQKGDSELARRHHLAAEHPESVVRKGLAASELSGY
jgi:tetratricopeptide (TPR) repeat protein